MQKLTVFGTCRLCLSEGVGLHNSHILPHWAYQRAAERTGGKNTNPVMVSANGARFSAEEAKEHMLCTECESRFRVPEGVAARFAYDVDRPSPLLALVHERGRSFPTATGNVGRCCALPHADGAALGYFACSVVWRSAVATVERSGTVKLGPYTETLRRFLLKPTAPPKDVTATVAVLESSSPLTLASSTPFTFRQPVHHLHRFMVAGLVLHVFAGKSSPKDQQRICLLHGSDKYAIVLEDVDVGLAKQLTHFANEAEPLGALARQRR